MPTLTASRRFTSTPTNREIENTLKQSPEDAIIISAENEAPEEIKKSKRQLEEMVEQNEDIEPGVYLHETSLKAQFSNDKGKLGFSGIKDAKPEEIREKVRNLMRTMPYPIVVVTAAAVDESNKPVPLGIAVSSFNTVTLDPPTVSFNIKHPSRTLDAIRAHNGRFKVHFLQSVLKSARVADFFTMGNNAKAYKQRQSVVDMKYEQDMNSRGSAAQPADIIDPIVVASLECELTQEVPVADHVIAVAEVSTIKARDHNTPLLTYFDGNYTQSRSAILRKHAAPAASNDRATSAIEPNQPDNHILWTLPLFPNEKNRKKYLKNLMQYVRERPWLFQTDLTHATVQLHQELSIPSWPLGVRDKSLIVTVAREEGCEIDHNPLLMDSPLLCDFYGNLSSSDIAVIRERAKEFVRSDPLFLALPYQQLFTFLGISIYSKGILSSDILNALREAGLAPPFQLFEGPSDKTITTGTLEHLEQVEHRAKEYLRTKNFTDALHISTNDINAAARLSNAAWSRNWIEQVRARLHVEVFPDFYSESHIDLQGRLSIYESRMAVVRIVRYVDRSNSTLRSWILHNWWELLRRCRIHPNVTGPGFDPNFFVLRLQYWSRNCTPSNFRTLVNNLLASHFQKNNKTTVIEERIDDLVKTNVRIVTNYKTKDILTALGLREEAGAYEKGVRTPLNETHLGHLLKKAIQNHYDDFSDELKAEVDRYLANAGTPTRKRTTVDRKKTKDKQSSFLAG